MRILTDFHHGSLYESFLLLFEDRFGWEVYKPIGMEWQTVGLWQDHYGDNRVAHQFLDHSNDDIECAVHSKRPDAAHPGRMHKMLTLEQARAIKPDIIIATLSGSENGFHALAREVGAKYGVHLGNQFATPNFEQADFALFSVLWSSYPDIPHVVYRQEFDLNNFYLDWPSREKDLVASWVHCMSDMPQDYQRFDALAKATPELRWHSYGHELPENAYWKKNLSTVKEVADSIRSARIAVHFKSHGDGYGHIAHNIFACGKPVIGTATTYRDRLAGPLFVDGVTSFDVEQHSLAEITALIQRLATDDDFHCEISQNSTQRFREVVSFEADAEAVKKMLERVL